MSVDRGLMIEQASLLGAVCDRHDVHIFEFWTGLAPVAMGENVVPPDFATNFDFAARRHRPMKQRIESCHPDPGLGRFDVLEKS